MSDDVHYQAANGVGTITIDRPDVRNAFTRETIQELTAALDRATPDELVDVIILTGTDDNFCAGADVSDLPNWRDRPKEEFIEYLRSVQGIVQRLRTAAQPTIAAVTGPAVGAGCDFALACDFRTIGTDAYLREGFIDIGLIPGDGGAWLLTRLLGEAKAKEILFRGLDISSQQAFDLGIATEVSDDPEAAAVELANELLAQPITALHRSKQLVHTGGTYESHCDVAVDYQWECLNHPEHLEALDALRKGREPTYDRKYERQR